ncbi:hypothetical protein [Salinisphaera sp. LB1]|uniref:hypothetical protein n=1 Tax=Salinisphaera sp. LB1 TaxID=2183911 RepID=UPI000D7D55E4|nr:hypothetical protein [Salinisphaera sp. LB1]AWN14548.1 hypothetical protein SALB1_0341 [Salinisphaera sp. LB1]
MEQMANVRAPHGVVLGGRAVALPDSGAGARDVLLYRPHVQNSHPMTGPCAIVSIRIPKCPNPDRRGGRGFFSTVTSEESQKK